MMPSVSKKQHNFMEAIAHSPSFAKKVGVPQKVGQDFASADKGRKFSKGGDTMATKMSMFEKSGKDIEKRGMKEGSKADMALDKKQMMGMKKGGMTMAAMKKGGMKKMSAGGVTASAMEKVRTAAPSRDGLAEKGKTRGMQVKMAGSGVPGGIGSRVMKKGGRAC
jgi:hypothetical protein